MAYPSLGRPIPPHWRLEHDHFLIYYSHSATLPARIRNSEAAVYGELLRTFLFEKAPSMLAVVQRIRGLAPAAERVLPRIVERGYWWACSHGANPWGGVGGGEKEGGEEGEEEVEVGGASFAVG